VALQALPE